MAGERWIFTPEQLANTPSRQAGIDADKETYYKQQAANFIQDMGQRLTVTQLCINTAIVYLHRFYMFQSFTKFHRNSLAQACLFLAAKVEEQPRKLEHVIKVSHMILHRDQPAIDTKGESYLEQAQELVVNENVLLQTLGFEFQVDHPHAHIVKTCNLIRAPKDLTQTSYFLATNSLHLTQMSLSYKPTFVACVCIHLACKWAQFEIPQSNEGKEWWFYVDKDMNAAILEELTTNFLSILDKCPSKFKKKLMSKNAKDEDLLNMLNEKKAEQKKEMIAARAAAQTSKSNDRDPLLNKTPKMLSPPAKPETSTSKGSHDPASEGQLRKVKTESSLTSLTTKEYFERREREKKERERLEREKMERERAERDKQRMAARDKDISSQPQGRDPNRKPQPTERHAPPKHTNIFDEMANVRPKPEPMDVTDHNTSRDKHLMERSQERHSLERSQTQQNYKDKYHQHDRGDKLTFGSPEMQRKPHRPHHEQRPDPTHSSRHSIDPKYNDPKYKARLSQEHKHPEQRLHHSKEARPEPSQPPSADPVRPQPPSADPVRDIIPVEKPVKVERLLDEIIAEPEKITAEVKKVEIDPEEGEILDDDSPVVRSQKEERKSSHDGDRPHHRHHHRERRTSGRHHSPGSAVAPPSGEVPLENRSKHRSLRTALPVKEESHVAKERKLSSSQYELPTESAVKAAELETIHSNVVADITIKRTSPEPGEIIEHSRKSQHHKSSHSKHKKHKDRDRDRSSHEGLKMKFDLKSIGGISTPSTMSPNISTEEKKKELKMKIKPPKEAESGQETPTGLKIKLKLPAGSTPTGAGNGETSKYDHHKGSDKISSSSALKLTLSKDSSSGQFITGSHKAHRHSSSGSRKRPFSPSDISVQRHKLPRNESSSNLSRLNDSGTSSPVVSGGPLTSPDMISNVHRQLQELIDKKAEEIERKKRHPQSLQNSNDSPSAMHS